MKMFGTRGCFIIKLGSNETTDSGPVGVLNNGGLLNAFRFVLQTSSPSATKILPFEFFRIVQDNDVVGSLFP